MSIEQEIREQFFGRPAKATDSAWTKTRPNVWEDADGNIVTIHKLHGDRIQIVKSRHRERAGKQITGFKSSFNEEMPAEEARKHLASMGIALDAARPDFLDAVDYVLKGMSLKGHKDVVQFPSDSYVLIHNGKQVFGPASESECEKESERIARGPQDKFRIVKA